MLQQLVEGVHQYLRIADRRQRPAGVAVGPVFPPENLISYFAAHQPQRPSNLAETLAHFMHCFIAHDAIAAIQRFHRLVDALADDFANGLGDGITRVQFQ